MNDTTPEAEQIVVDVYRRMSMSDKWRQVGELYRTGRVLHEGGFRQRHPSATAAEIVDDWMKLTSGLEVIGKPVVPSMDTLSEGLGEVRRVARALERIGVPYALGGSMASSLLGAPRFTQDADLTIEPFAGREAALAACFSSDYYLSVPAMEEANRARRSFNIVNLKSGFKIDLFVRKERPFDRSALARRINVELADAPGEPLCVLSAEDVLLFKLEWYRLGDEVSDRQWGDILGLLRVQGDRLDQAYLRHWADELGVSDLLERAQANLQ